MGLRRTIDLETHRGRERARDIIAKMPNLNRHDIYGGAPAYTSGGASPDFGFTGYDPGCGDCLPECADKSLKLCVWPHGEVFWPADESGTNVGFPEHNFANTRGEHGGNFSSPLSWDGVSTGYQIQIRRPKQFLTTPSGFFTYPFDEEDVLPLMPFQYRVTPAITFRAYWKGPGDIGIFAPWRNVFTDPPPWGLADFRVDYHATDEATASGLQDLSDFPAPIGTVTADLAPEVGTLRPISVSMVDVSQVNRQQLALSIVYPLAETFDAEWASAGYSLEFQLDMFAPVGQEDFGAFFLGHATGCIPPAGTVVDEVGLVLEADGSFRTPTPNTQLLAVYFDGLLAVPAIHYTVVDGKVVPSTALLQGTKVSGRYVADGSTVDLWQ